MAGAQTRIEQALSVASAFGQTPGAQTWVIDQMVRALLGRRYDDWVSSYRTGESDGLETHRWSEGRAPAPQQLALLNWGTP